MLYEKNKKRLLDYVRDFPLFLEMLIFFFLLAPRLRSGDVSKFLGWAKGFRVDKRVSKKKLEVLLVFTDCILHNIKYIKNTCLNRSLVLFNFLSRMGEPVVINFGVRKEKDLLKGHGWLTKNGKAFLEKDDTYCGFKRILSFSAAGYVQQGDGTILKTSTQVGEEVDV